VIPLYLYFELGHVGLALATSAAAWLNAGLLFRGLRRDGVLHHQRGWGVFLARLLFATGAMVLAVIGLSPAAADWATWGWHERALRMLLVCGGGGLAYLLAHFGCGTRLAHLRSSRAT
jgi:putative peptidoglycan lipid II flippase